MKTIYPPILIRADCSYTPLVEIVAASHSKVCDIFTNSKSLSVLLASSCDDLYQADSTVYSRLSRLVTGEMAIPFLSPSEEPIIYMILIVASVDWMKANIHSRLSSSGRVQGSSSGRLSTYAPKIRNLWQMLIMKLTQQELRQRYLPEC